MTEPNQRCPENALQATEYREEFPVLQGQLNIPLLGNRNATAGGYCAHSTTKMNSGPHLLQYTQNNSCRCCKAFTKYGHKVVKENNRLSE